MLNQYQIYYWLQYKIPGNPHPHHTLTTKNDITRTIHDGLKLGYVINRIDME